MITRQDIAAHLERMVKTEFLKGSRDYEPLRSAFVQESSSDGAFETYADMGDVPWPVQNAGVLGPAGTDSTTGAQQTNSMSEGSRITVLGGEERSLIVYNVDWEISIGIYHNAINDDRTGRLEDWARGAAANFEKHKDFLCFDALNSGGSTTSDYGLCYDGQAFFSASHVDPGAEYTTSQSNQFALPLNLDNFETAKVAGAKFLDSRGQPTGLNHNLLIVPPDNERVAAQITSNRTAYDTANREINPYEGTVTHMVSPGGWLDTTSWFLLDVSQPQKPLVIQTRKDPELSVWDDEYAGSGGIRYFKWHARYAVAYGSWRLALEGNT